MDDRLGFCDHCGQRYRPGATGAPGAAGGGHEACRAARALEPPRYCSRCGRRTAVKVTPTGWSSHCSRHGQTTAA